MKTKILGLLAAGLMAGPTGAGAVELIVNQDGVLVGATGVVVAGATYNVEFVAGTCIELFSGCDEVGDFTFQDAASAEAAANALLSSVFTGIYDTDPSRTFNCTANGCFVLTPFNFIEFPGPILNVLLFTAFNTATDDNTALQSLAPSDDLVQFPDIVYARWTSVPEPGSLALLGLGLAGLSLSRRRKAA